MANDLAIVTNARETGREEDAMANDLAIVTNAREPGRFKLLGAPYATGAGCPPSAADARSKSAALAAAMDAEVPSRPTVLAPQLARQGLEVPR